MQLPPGHTKIKTGVCRRCLRPRADSQAVGAWRNSRPDQRWP